MKVYVPTTKEIEWVKKNSLEYHSLTGVQSWYNNTKQYIHDKKTYKIIATREFTFYTCTNSECDITFESKRIDKRNGETLYKVCFRVYIKASF